VSEPTLRHASAAVAVLLAAALLLAGCSSAKKPESLAERTTIFGFPLSDYQRKILADGYVSPAEYRAAVEAQRDCVIHAGIHAGDITEDIDGVHLHFGVGECPPGGDCQVAFKVAQAAFDKCGFEYVYAIEAKVTNQAIPTGADAEREFAKVALCLKEAGVPGVLRSDKEEDVHQRIGRALPDENSLQRRAADGCMYSTLLYFQPFKEDG
jgi:hypothetical protein